MVREKPPSATAAGQRVLEFAREMLDAASVLDTKLNAMRKVLRKELESLSTGFTTLRDVN